MPRVCPLCFRDYKHSPEGEEARRTSEAGEEAAWGRGKWPEWVYTDAKKRKKGSKRRRRGRAGSFGERLCGRHRKPKTEKTDFNEVFTKLGYKSYEAYISSLEWYKIRKRALALFSDGCHFCDSRAAHVHHRSYSPEVLLGRKLSELYPVCKPCHDHGHQREKNQYTTPKRATDRMRERAVHRKIDMDSRDRVRAFLLREVRERIPGPPSSAGRYPGP